MVSNMPNHAIMYYLKHYTFKYADGFQYANTRDCVLCEALLLQMKMISADEFQHANTRVCV
jgi:hypothetical protein